ncbi:hypothetical protein B0H14DRAFT_3423191 [Mycena olivaceomarginata]|nr:hypothetical protein B0H14DRAFT_3423191 [Mycena olivaceomarginata]
MQTQGTRGTRSRPGLMPACPSNNEVPVGPLALEGALARKPNDRCEEHTRLHVLLSTRPWDVYAYDRRMPRFIASGGHEQDALLVYNSRTQGSEPCCRPGVTWKRARAAPHESPSRATEERARVYGRDASNSSTRVS